MVFTIWMSAAAARGVPRACAANKSETQAGKSDLATVIGRGGIGLVRGSVCVTTDGDNGLGVGGVGDSNEDDETACAIGAKIDNSNHTLETNKHALPNANKMRATRANFSSSPSGDIRENMINSVT
jgi:hypothetical protein